MRVHVRTCTHPPTHIINIPLFLSPSKQIWSYIFLYVGYYKTAVLKHFGIRATLRHRNHLVAWGKRVCLFIYLYSICIPPFNLRNAQGGRFVCLPVFTRLMMSSCLPVHLSFCAQPLCPLTSFVSVLCSLSPTLYHSCLIGLVFLLLQFPTSHTFSECSLSLL